MAKPARRDVDTSFFSGPTLDVARSLVGCRLRRGTRVGLVVEVEAYTDDAASHFVTRAPSAGALMGSTHGLAYVYSIYGEHLCLNVTTDARAPGAVLLRALEPVVGLHLMRRARGACRDRDLCRGPARLARAFGVTKAMSGRPFLELFELELPGEPVEVVTVPRVGISVARHLPWRFCLAGSPFVSDPRPRPGA